MRGRSPEQRENLRESIVKDNSEQTLLDWLGAARRDGMAKAGLKNPFGMHKDTHGDSEDLGVGAEDFPIPTTSGRINLSETAALQPAVASSEGRDIARSVANAPSKTTDDFDSQIEAHTNAETEHKKALEEYKASRSAEYAAKFKDESGAWKKDISDEEADAHAAETAAGIQEHKGRIAAAQNSRTAARNKRTTALASSGNRLQETVSGNDTAPRVTPEGKVVDVEGALNYHMGNFQALPDGPAKEAARTAYHKIGVEQGYSARIATPCASGKCGNIIPPEAQSTKGQEPTEGTSCPSCTRKEMAGASQNPSYAVADLAKDRGAKPMRGYKE